MATITSCCFSIKEEHLGNNLYLSEFDNVDRCILYSEEGCTGSGIQIVPITVMEYNYNSEWIIAKAGNKRSNSDFSYWIIKNNYDDEPTVKIITSNTTGPLGFDEFTRELIIRKINLKLRKVD
jgi:hypothetical protein